MAQETVMAGLRSWEQRWKVEVELALFWTRRSKSTVIIYVRKAFIIFQKNI